MQQSSYAHGTGDRPLLGATVGGCLAAAAREAPERDAVVVAHEGLRLTWSELDRRCDELAAGLADLGLEPGDRIGICAPNGSAWVVSQFATARAGLVLVNINPAYRAAELEHALASVGCRALVTVARFRTSDYLEMLRGIAPEVDGCRPGELRAERLPRLRHLLVVDGEPPRAGRRLEEVEASPGGRARVAALADLLQFDDPINIQFTSGTTGAPKAATLSHHNIVNNAWLSGCRMALGPTDRLCIPVPMYHCFGMVLGTLCATVHHAAMVLPSAGFDAGATLAAVEAERCTALHGVPTMFIAELDHPDRPGRDLASLRTGIMAGAPCPVELMHRVMEEMHLTGITIAYGMTETGPVSTQTWHDDPLQRRVETVGSPLPYTEVAIVDAAGRIVPRGVAGELRTRGYCVMRGYWEDPERTAEAVDAAGWMASGDLAMMDDDGCCRIVGRIKDMLIRGGENVYPREIEEVLYAHPAVDEAEVIGVPDPRYGEEVCAWIRLRPGSSATAEGIRDHCRRRLARFKVPRYVKFVDEFPMTVTGKVQKFAMREQMERELADG